VWSIVMYRRPLLAGAMIGLAFGTIYYPVFLLPLWISFYWERGLSKFFIGMLLMVGLLVLALALTSSDMSMFLAGLKQMFGWRFPVSSDLSGVGQFYAEYRSPIIVAHVGLSLSCMWPRTRMGTPSAIRRHDAVHPPARPQRRVALAPPAAADNLPAQPGRPRRRRW
jgi:hypothetical protein